MYSTLLSQATIIYTIAKNNAVTAIFILFGSNLSQNY